MFSSGRRKLKLSLLEFEVMLEVSAAQVVDVIMEEVELEFTPTTTNTEHCVLNLEERETHLMLN